MSVSSCILYAAYWKETAVPEILHQANTTCSMPFHKGAGLGS